MKSLKAFSILLFISLLALGCGGSGRTGDELTTEDYFNRGYAHTKKGEHNEAIEDYTKSIELNPRPAAYNNRGLAYKGLGQYEEAIQDFNQAIDLYSSLLFFTTLFYSI
jgi:tetratricopeptide (TPR) repeat protein